MTISEMFVGRKSVCLFPKDFKRMRRFYEDVFGFKPKRVQNEGTEAELENPNFIEYDFAGATFGLWDREATAEIMGDENLLPPSDRHNFFTAIRLKTPEDVDLVHEGFMEKGVKCLAAPTNYHFGSRAAYYQDPEGFVWEFYAWLNGKDGPSLV